MKHAFFLFVFSLLLFGCDTSVNSDNTVTAVGVVHKIEMSTWMYGTHTLADSSGKHLYALTGSSVDLNSYENKKVRITGNLIDGYPVDGGPMYINVTGISIIE